MAIFIDKQMVVRSAPTVNKKPLFGDLLIQATELNRRGGSVLDMALQRPVTITRKNESFALLRRDVAAHWYAISDEAELFLTLLGALYELRVEKKLPEDHPYHWLSRFDEGDRDYMVRDLIEAFAEVVSGKDPEAVSLTLVEWQDSYDVMESGILAEAMAEPADPVPLTPPDEIFGGFDE